MPPDSSFLAPEMFAKDSQLLAITNLLVNRLREPNLTAKQQQQAIAKFFEFFNPLTTDRVLDPNGWERREHFFYQPLLRLSSIQLGGLRWEKGDVEDWHRHHAYPGGLASAFIKVMEGNAIHEVAEVIGNDQNSGKVLIKPIRQEVLRTGDVAVVKANEAHLLGNKSASPLTTIHLYLPPVLKPKNVERLKIVREAMYQT